MATYARRFIAAGARLVGGCCGTTPDHIRQIAQAVKTMAPAAARRGAGCAGRRAGRPTAAPVARAREVRLWRANSPPATLPSSSKSPRREGWIVRPVVAQAQRFRDLGAVAVNVPDYPEVRRARRARWRWRVLLEEQAGVETVLHYCCRDRHLIGMQSDLVGAHAMGIRNLLRDHGQSRGRGEHSRRDVRVRRGRDRPDQHGVATQSRSGHRRAADRRAGAFHVGVAVNPFAPDPDAEWRRLMHKVEAGAEFIVTPPVFDVEAFGAVLDRLTATGLPVLAGLAAHRRPAARGVHGQRGRRRQDSGRGRSTGCAARRTKQPKRWP